MKSSGLQIAAFGSVLLSALVAYSSYCGLAGYEDIRLTATTLVALAGTLVGFTLTALSLLIGISDRAFIQNLRQTGHFANLVRQLFRAAGLWLAVAALGLIAHTQDRELQGLIVPLAMGFATLAFLQFLVVARRFAVVMRILTQ